MATSARALDGGVRTLLVSLGVGSATVAPAVLGGLVAGLYAVVASVSYPSLIFSGELAAYEATGIGMALLGPPSSPTCRSSRSACSCCTSA